MLGMFCTTCGNSVLRNATGICLSCQRGFIGLPQEDDLAIVQAKELEERKKEIEDALQKREPAQVPLGDESKSRRRIRKQDTKSEKASKKSKKEG